MGMHANTPKTAAQRLLFLAGALFVVASSLGCTSAGSSGTPLAVNELPTVASETTPAIEIVAASVTEEDGRTLLRLTGSAPLSWTSYREADDALVVELPGAVPAVDVSDPDLTSGIIQRLELEPTGGEMPAARLVVATRADAEHSVAVEGLDLIVELEPIEWWKSEVVATVASLNSDPLPSTYAFSEDEDAAPDEPSVGPAPSGVPATQLHGVDVATSDGSTVVSIAGDGSFYYSTFTLDNPNRFVVDLIGVVNTSPVSTVTVQGPLVDGVRVAQYKPQPELVSRVVVDLVQQAVPEVEATSDGLRLTFFEDSAYAAPVAAAAVAEPVYEEVEEAAAMAEPVYEEVEEAAAAVAEPVYEEVEEAAAMAEPVYEEVEEAAAMAEPVYEEVEEAAAAVAEPVYEEVEEAAAMAEPVYEEVEEAAAAMAEPVYEGVEEAAAMAEPVYEEPEAVAEIAEAPADAWRSSDTYESDAAAEQPSDPWAAVQEEASAYADEPLPSEASLLDFAAAEITAEGEVAAPAFGTQEVGGTEETQYFGEPMTMTLRDADIKDVLRSFAQISGLNVVVQPEVSGTVTVELTNVPWDQALDQILKINGLGYQLEGNIMRVASLQTLQAEEESKARLAEAKARSIPLKTIMRRVSYAGANEIASILRSGGGASIMSARGSVVVDARTNTLIIKELPSHINTVIAVIENLDIPEPQVMIEARIIETTKRFSRTLGVQWGFSGIASPEFGNTTGLQFPNRGTVDGGVSLLTGGQNGFLDITLGNVLNSFNLDLALQAAENEGLINILSAPKITTLNNERATIQSGLQIPIQTIANNTVSVQFVNATLRLEVTPHVTAEGTVLMDIDIQKREPQLAFAVVGAANAPIATKDASTRVIVRDGGTTVIGGIYKVTSDQGEDRVPGLANVPILKHLFRNKRRNDENEELLIFITPRVIRL